MGKRKNTKRELIEAALAADPNADYRAIAAAIPGATYSYVRAVASKTSQTRGRQRPVPVESLTKQQVKRRRYYTPRGKPKITLAGPAYSHGSSDR